MLGTIITTIIIFSIIIFIHELGHFLIAKKNKITVHEFALGMGPKLFSFVKNDTRYSIRAFPIGGYVQMEGEDEESDDPNSFNKKPILARIATIVAGAAMNLILGFLVLILMNSLTPQYASTTISMFNEGSISNTTGLAVGDEIQKVNSTSIFNDKDLITAFLSDEDGIYKIIVKRNNEKVILNEVKLNSFGDGDTKKLNIDFKVEPIERSFLTVLDQSWRGFVSLARTIWLSLGDLLTGKVGFSEISGPVGVGEVISSALNIGFSSILFITALLSINIGIFNLLPIPALDGGRLIFLLIELVRRKPLNPKYEGIVHTVGFVLLIGLMLLVTFKDVLGLFN